MMSLFGIPSSSKVRGQKLQKRAHESTALLLQLFPQADPLWLQSLVVQVQDSRSDKLLSTRSLVEQISEKILQLNYGWYPQIQGTPDSLEARNAFLKDLNQRFPVADIGFLRSCILSTQSNHGTYNFIIMQQLFLQNA